MQVDSGIEAVGSVQWGAHFCQFYENADDLVDTLVPFFKAGLDDNQRCMWVTANPLRADDATSALRSAVPDLDRRLAGGQIEALCDAVPPRGKRRPQQICASKVRRLRHQLGQRLQRCIR